MINLLNKIFNPLTYFLAITAIIYKFMRTMDTYIDIPFTSLHSRAAEYALFCDRGINSQNIDHDKDVVRSHGPYNK